VLISRHAPSVFSVTTRMLGRAADAEDVAQDTFVSAYKALSRFQFESKFSTWLYRIAVNKCTDVLRSRRPGHVSLDSSEGVDMAAWPAVDDDTPHEELERIELASELERGIQALPPLYRESFVLKHVEGLGYDEMSDILGVPRDTLKMRVYKARTLLCRSLSHLAGVR
jgi:RNA polymerase sigma-70 factor (ECF subfamily)